MEGIKLGEVHFNGQDKELSKSLTELCKPPFKYEHLRITAEKEIEIPEPFIKIGSAPVARAGNLTGISAPSKAGKTAIAGVILSEAICIESPGERFSQDLFVKPNPDRKAVINIDTEQDEADQQYNVRTILKRSRITKTPDYFHQFNITPLPFSEYKTALNEICEYCSELNGGIHLIIADGGADFIRSVNDEEESFNIILYFRSLSIKYNCPVIIVVHQNPVTGGGLSTKERGHFGSFLQRKCFGIMEVTKEGDVSTLSTKLLRRGGSDVPLIHFKYSIEHGYHVALEPDYKERKKEDKEIAELTSQAAGIFPATGSLNYTSAWKALMESTGLGQATCKSRISKMAKLGIITKGGDGEYRSIPT